MAYCMSKSVCIDQVVYHSFSDKPIYFIQIKWTLKYKLFNFVMSNFSDKEDKILIQFVLREEANGKSRISWSHIAKRMRTKKRPEQLRLRVNKLKQRFDTDFGKCPAWYSNEGIVRNKAQTESTKKVVVNAVKGTTEQTSNKENLDSKKKDDKKGDDDSLAVLASLSDDDTSVNKRRPLPNLILPGVLPDSEMEKIVIDRVPIDIVSSNPPRKALRRRSKQRTAIQIQSHNAVWNLYSSV